MVRWGEDGRPKLWFLESCWGLWYLANWISDGFLNFNAQLWKVQGREERDLTPRRRSIVLELVMKRRNKKREEKLFHFFSLSNIFTFARSFCSFFLPTVIQFSFLPLPSFRITYFLLRFQVFGAFALLPICYLETLGWKEGFSLCFQRIHFTSNEIPNSLL